MPPEKPADLSVEASEHWDAIVEELARLDLLKPLDGGALAMVCETWARWRQAQRLLAAEGLLAPQGYGRHPAVSIIEAATREYRSWCAEFGLTPSAEGKLGSGNKERESGSNPFTRSADSS